MKILVTGPNSLQCSKSSVHDFRGGKGVSCAIFATLAVLRDKYGAENVIQQPVRPGDKKLVDSVDLVLMYPMPVGGWTSAFALGAAWATAYAHEKLVYGVDDWQISKVHGVSEAMLRGLDGRFWETESKAKVFDSYADWKASKKDREFIRAGFAKWMEPWDRPTIMPTFYGQGAPADMGLDVKRDTPVLTFDPSGYFHTKTNAPNFNDKKKQLVYSSLTNRNNWLEGAEKEAAPWPVLAYGNRSSGQERLTEADLNLKQRESWGILCPPTGHAKGAWWRNRFLFGAEMGTAVIGAPSELKFCGSSYDIMMADFVKLSDQDLAAVCLAQRDDFFGSMWSSKKLAAKTISFFDALS